MSADVEIESYLEEIVRVLSDQGPLTRRELRNSVQSRLGDSDQFPRALRLAVRRGLVLRQGSRFASAMGEG
jgi:predicted HTH transcriptional regulator